MGHRHQPRPFTTICTDGKSPLKAIECRSPVRSLLKACRGPTTLLRVPGHKEILAMSLKVLGPKQPLSHQCPSEPYFLRVREAPHFQNTDLSNTQPFSWSSDCKANGNCAERVLLARFRAGLTPYANLLEPFAGLLCPFCKEERRIIGCEDGPARRNKIKLF